MIGAWLLDEIVPAIPIPIVSCNDSTPAYSEMSGMEIISLHKSTTKGQQHHCTIEGLGEVRTSWIGQKGVRTAMFMCFSVPVS